MTLLFFVGGAEGGDFAFPVAGVTAAEAVVVAALGGDEFAWGGVLLVDQSEDGEFDIVLTRHEAMPQADQSSINKFTLPNNLIALLLY